MSCLFVRDTSVALYGEGKRVERGVEKKGARKIEFCVCVCVLLCDCVIVCICVWLCKLHCYPL